MVLYRVYLSRHTVWYRTEFGSPVSILYGTNCTTWISVVIMYCTVQSVCISSRHTVWYCTEFGPPVVILYGTVQNLDLSRHTWFFASDDWCLAD